MALTRRGTASSRMAKVGQGQGRKRVPPENYTVGWICALSSELKAAIAMLDEEHEGLESQPKHDENSYSLGRIGEHYVTIACLPEYGTAPAAVVAKSMQSTFPNLRFGLMVGIGGGVPSAENDIRLGDIVVSLPNNQGGGVIQYDLGRREVDRFRPVGTLNKPPILLRTTVKTLRVAENLGADIAGMVNNAFEETEQDDEEWTYPKKATDVLYRYDHDRLLSLKSFSFVVVVAACFPLAYYIIVYALSTNDVQLRPLYISLCALITGICFHITARRWESINRVVKRNPRKTTNPKIFYGNIGSGNSVMKNSSERDFIAKRDDVICFEMEAAGLMDHFPCLVIRGISDYADSQKNWLWQPYAAAVAAAYAKKLLLVVAPEAVKDLKPIRSE